MTIEQTVAQLLSGVTGAFGTDLYSMAKDDVLDSEEWPLAQRLELPTCCDLCRLISGKIVRKSDPAYRRWLRQVHMNCRGIWVDIHKDEGHEETGPDGKARWVPTQPNWTEDDIPEGWVEKYGHFIHQPAKYGALNVPARPTGLDFVFSKGKDGAPGKLSFAPNLPDRLIKQTLQHIASETMAAAVADSAPLDRLAATLEQCVRQPARRAAERPDEFISHFAADAAKHGERMGLGRDQYAALPQSIMDEPHSLALVDYTFTSFNYQTRRVLMVVSDESDGIGRVRGFFWDPKSGQIWHPGTYGKQYFTSKLNRLPLTGEWR